MLALCVQHSPSFRSVWCPPILRVILVSLGVNQLVSNCVYLLFTCMHVPHYPASTEAWLTWQQANPPIYAQTLLLLPEAALAFAGQQWRVLGQQSVLSLQALGSRLLPERGHRCVGRTQLQAPVQRLTSKIGGAHTMSFNAVGGGGREREDGCWGWQHT